MQPFDRQRKMDMLKEFAIPAELKVSPLLSADEALELSRLYCEGYGTLRDDWKKSREDLYLHAARLGNVEAQYKLACSYDNNFHEISLLSVADKFASWLKNGNSSPRPEYALNRAAFAWYKRAADKGHSVSCCRLALKYAAERNFDEAFMWLHAAQREGNLLGKFVLGAFLLQESDYKDEVRALELLGYAAERNMSTALKLLFDYYYEEKKYDEAAKWAELAADNGAGGIPEKFGQMLYYGKECERNVPLAVKILNTPGRKSKQTSLILAYIYLRGEGVKRDYDEAFRHLRDLDYIREPNAARYMNFYAEAQLYGIRKYLAKKTGTPCKEGIDSGLANAPVVLGIYMYYGKGIKQNKYAAESIWYTFAKAGDPLAARMYARKKIDEAADGYTEYDIRQAREMLMPLANKGDRQATEDLKRYGLLHFE